MTRSPSFDINDPTFQRILAEAVAARMAAEKAAEKVTDTGKTDKAGKGRCFSTGYRCSIECERGARSSWWTMAG
jgi:hypothetical protein